MLRNKDSEDENNGSKDGGRIVNLKNASILDAKILFIAASGTSNIKALGITRTATGVDYNDVDEMNTPKLYKITATGQTYEVQFVDNSGEVIPVVTECFVNLLGEFVLLRVYYENSGYDEKDKLVTYRVEMMLIVDLKDGTVVSVDNNSPYAQPLGDIISVSK